MTDGTPIIDIKPYLPYTDSRPDALGGFADEVKDYSLRVDLPEALTKGMTEEQRTALTDILMQDPRPSYHDDPERIYGFGFADYEIKFRVCGEVLTVTDIIKTDIKKPVDR
jgi:hypothetical protein